MIRIFATVTLMAALVAPAFAADPPMVINMPSANKAAPAAAQDQAKPAKPADQLPKVVNYPSGSDGTMPAPKPATDAAKTTAATMAVVAMPSVYPIVNAGMMNPYGGLSSDYSMSMYGVPGYMSSGFAASPYFAASMMGGFGYGAYPPANGYFYTFAPAAMLYRDITSTPLGKTAYFQPDGTVIENPGGFMGYSGAAMILR
jgi:hypothetical protein